MRTRCLTKVHLEGLAHQITHSQHCKPWGGHLHLGGIHHLGNDTLVQHRAVHVQNPEDVTGVDVHVLVVERPHRRPGCGRDQPHLLGTSAEPSDGAPPDLVSEPQRLEGIVQGILLPVPATNPSDLKMDFIRRASRPHPDLASQQAACSVHHFGIPVQDKRLLWHGGLDEEATQSKEPCHASAGLRSHLRSGQQASDPGTTTEVPLRVVEGRPLAIGEMEHQSLRYLDVDHGSHRRIEQSVHPGHSLNYLDVPNRRETHSDARYGNAGYPEVLQGHCIESIGGYRWGVVMPDDRRIVWQLPTPDLDLEGHHPPTVHPRGQHARYLAHRFVTWDHWGIVGPSERTRDQFQSWIGTN